MHLKTSRLSSHKLFAYFTAFIFTVIVAIVATTGTASAVDGSSFIDQIVGNYVPPGQSGNVGGGNSGGGSTGGGGSTRPTPTPAPAPPVQTEWDFSQNGVTIKSSCPPFAGEGASLICPKSETGFEYVGGVDPAQSAAAPEGNDHNLGIWKRTTNGASVCGVKSRPGSTPPLAFLGGDHMWILPNCPETATQVLQRIGADCASENPNFLNAVVLQVGSQGYCIPYMKAFFKIVLLNQYYPTTWRDPDGVFNEVTKTEVEAFQTAMKNALENVDFNSSVNQASKTEYLDKGMAVNATGGKLSLPVDGKFEKAEWSWLTVFTYLYILANNNNTTY